MSKDILFVFSRFKPYVGGAERQLERIAYGLIEEGYRVDVIARKHLKGLSYRENINKINITRIPIIRLNKFTEKLTFIVFTLIYLIIKRKKYDVIIASQLGSCSYIASIYKRFSRTPFITRIAGAEAELMAKTQRGRKKAEKVASNVDNIISINNKIYRDLIALKFPEKKILSITNGVKLNKPIDILKNTNIVYCGRIERVKGLDVLLEAMRILEEIDSKIKLIILGDGSEKSYLQEKYRTLRNIEWVGEVSNPSEYYRKSRILIIPSRYEGISNTLLEAMACGLPVIATKVDGNIEVIEDQVNGALIDSEDSKKLADEINSLYYDFEKLNMFQLKGLDKIKKSYSIDTAINKYIGAITKICS